MSVEKVAQWAALENMPGPRGAELSCGPIVQEEPLADFEKACREIRDCLTQSRAIMSELKSYLKPIWINGAMTEPVASRPYIGTGLGRCLEDVYEDASGVRAALQEFIQSIRI